MGFADGGAEFVECGFRRCEEDCAAGIDALGDAEAEAGDGRGAVVIPVVEIGTGLAGDGESVFESSCGDEGDAGAFAFEERVSGDRGAMADFDGIGADERADAADGFEDGTAGVVGSGG